MYVSIYRYLSTSVESVANRKGNVTANARQTYRATNNVPHFLEWYNNTIMRVFSGTISQTAVVKGSNSPFCE